MDNGTNDLLTSLLSNPESLKMLMTVAKSFLSSSQSTDNSSAQVQAITEALPQTPQKNTDTQILPQNNNETINADTFITKKVPDSFDERTNLIKSIKPYLAPGKRQKADSLIQALNVAKLINTYTSTNIGIE